MNGNVLKPIEILLVEDNIGDIRLTEWRRWSFCAARAVRPMHRLPI